MIFSYLVFAVLGFIMISTFTARYNQKYLEKHFASALRRESNLIATSFGTNYYSSDMTLTQFQKQLYAVGSYLNADIYVVDTDGKILVTSTESWEATDSEMIPDFDILDFGSDYYNINHFYNLYDSDVLSVYTPVTHNYSVSCYVLICEPHFRSAIWLTEQLLSVPDFSGTAGHDHFGGILLYRLPPTEYDL